MHLIFLSIPFGEKDQMEILFSRFEIAKIKREYIKEPT